MTSERPQVTPMGKYTVIKAARLLGMTPRNIYRWIDNGIFEKKECGVLRYGHKGVFIYGRGILRVWNAIDK